MGPQAPASPPPLLQPSWPGDILVVGDIMPPHDIQLPVLPALCSMLLMLLPMLPGRREDAPAAVHAPPLLVLLLPAWLNGDMGDSVLPPAPGVCDGAGVCAAAGGEVGAGGREA